MKNKEMVHGLNSNTPESNSKTLLHAANPPNLTSSVFVLVWNDSIYPLLNDEVPFKVKNLVDHEGPINAQTMLAKYDYF